MKTPIYPCIWLNPEQHGAKEAFDFYINTFGNGKIMSNSPMVVMLELFGQQFMGLNGGPQHKPNAATSFMVVFEDKQKLETVWEKLIQNGNVLMPLNKYDWSKKYGWAEDQFGVSWQLYLGKLDDVHQQRIIPTFMYSGANQGKAEKAVNFYTALFENTQLDGVMKYESGEFKGQVMHAQFLLNGYVLAAMDSGVPQPFTFDEGISMVIECDTQEDIDTFWNAFADGGTESMCGWVRDRFGVWWQVIPTVLKELLSDSEKGHRVSQAFMKMKKFDIQTLLEI